MQRVVFPSTGVQYVIVLVVVAPVLNFNFKVFVVAEADEGVTTPIFVLEMMKNGQLTPSILT